MRTDLYISKERRYDLLSALLLEYGKNPAIGQDRFEFIELLAEITSSYFNNDGMSAQEAIDYVEDSVSYMGIGFGREDYIDDFLADLDYIRRA